VPATREGTPDVSDDEGTGDYEDLLGYLSTAQDSTKKRLRSARSSYADLQNLKTPAAASTTGMTTITVLSGGLKLRMPGDSGSANHSPDSPTMRTGTRSRKASLSGSVDVKRLEVLPQEEQTFAEATAELNRENSMNRRKVE